VRFDPRGSFAPVYQAQSSDENFAAGFAGAALTDADYRDILPRVMRGEGFLFSVEIIELENNNHPNRVDLELTVTDRNGAERTDLYAGASVGGGMYYIDAMNGDAVLLTGKTASVFVWGSDIGARSDDIAAGFVENGNRLLGISVDPDHDRCEIALQALPDTKLIASLRDQDGIKDVRFAAASQYPVCATDDLFSTRDPRS